MVGYPSVHWVWKTFFGTVDVAEEWTVKAGGWWRNSKLDLGTRHLKGFKREREVTVRQQIGKVPRIAAEYVLVIR